MYRWYRNRSLCGWVDTHVRALWEWLEKLCVRCRWCKVTVASYSLLLCVLCGYDVRVSVVLWTVWGKEEGWQEKVHWASPPCSIMGTVVPAECIELHSILCTRHYHDSDIWVNNTTNVKDNVIALALWDNVNHTYFHFFQNLFLMVKWINRVKVIIIRTRVSSFSHDMKTDFFEISNKRYIFHGNNIFENMH